MYQYSHLEDYIKDLYQKSGINMPQQLNKFVIADCLNIGLYPVDGASEAIYVDGRQYIFINRNLTRQERWQDFGHELCHVLRHSGHQSFIPPPFRQLQEWQANSFMHHFCVPTFMLHSINLSTNYNKAIWDIQKKFNVTHEFAEKRLDMYYSKIITKGANNIGILQKTR